MAGLNLFTNNAATTLASSISNVATSLTVANATGSLFPTLTGADYFFCTLANNAGTTEIVKVTARSTDTFTIVRGQDGTSAVSWSAGDKVELRLTRIDLLNFPQLDSTNTFATTQTFTANPVMSGLTASKPVFTDASKNLISTGTLGADQGGTGLATLTANNVLLGNGTSAVQFVAPGTAGNVLQSNGTTWTSAAVPSSSGGATVTSSAVDITLTSSSNRVQNVSMTASGRYVILPDATTLTAGGPIFVIQNAGLYNFGIKDAAGNILINALTGSITPLYLTSIATSAGNWYTSELDLGLNLNPPSLSTITVPYTTSASATALTSSLVVFAYNNTAQTIVNLVAATISGSTLTFGTPVAAHTVSGSVYPRGVAKLSSTGGVLATEVLGSSNSTRVIGFSVSGTTITLGAATNLGSAASPSSEKVKGLCSLGGSIAVVQYLTSNTTNRVRAMTISGATLTLGTAVTTTASTSSGTNTGITALDASTFVFNDASNTRLGSVSGTTITLGTGNSTLSFDGGGVSGYGTAIVSGTQFWNSGYLVTWTGTTISSVTLGNPSCVPTGSYSLAMPKYGSNFYNVNLNPGIVSVQIADTSTISSPVTYYNTSDYKFTAVIGFEYIDSSTMILFGTDTQTSGYLGAQIITVL